MTRVICQQSGGVRFVNHQAVVVIDLFASFDFAQCADENALTGFIGLAVGRAGVVDPARIIAALQCIDHMFFTDMEVKRVIRVFRIVGVALLRFFPTDNLTDVFDQNLAFGDVCQGKHPFAVNA